MLVGLDSPQEYYSYLHTINHSEIGVMFTNLAIVWGPHFVEYLVGGLKVQCAHLEKYEDFVNGFRMTSHIISG